MTHYWCPSKPENEQADVCVLKLRLACTVFFHSAAAERLCDCCPSCRWWIRWCTMRSKPIHVFIRGGPVRTDFQLLYIPGTHIWNEWLQLKGSLEAARWNLLMDCGTFFGFFSGDTVDVEDKTAPITVRALLQVISVLLILEIKALIPCFSSPVAV